MGGKKSLYDLIRNTAAADMFKTVATEEGKDHVLESFRRMPDEALNLLASSVGVPTHQVEIYRCMVRGESNEFSDKLDSFKDQLETGDVILVTGKSKTSKILVTGQKGVYPKARSSHVVVVHSDFICVDAIGSVGVSNRLITEVLQGVEDNWRVIRFDKITEQHRDEMLTKCAYYLEQPYRIFPKRRASKRYSYCSELARKIYFDSGVDNCMIPSNIIIKPCDFDRLADRADSWSDVTESVRPYIEFCCEYSALIKITSKVMVDGLKLNRSRSQERLNMIRMIRKLQKDNKLSDEKASEMIKNIHQLEDKMNFQFWDSSNKRAD